MALSGDPSPGGALGNPEDVAAFLPPDTGLGEQDAGAAAPETAVSLGDQELFPSDPRPAVTRPSGRFVPPAQPALRQAPRGSSSDCLPQPFSDQVLQQVVAWAGWRPVWVMLGPPALLGVPSKPGQCGGIADHDVL